MKKSLLLAYTNPYIFYESVFPALEEFSRDFLVGIVLVGEYFPIGLENDLNLAFKNKILNYLKIINIEGPIEEVEKGLIDFKSYIDRHEFDLLLIGTETDMFTSRLLNLPKTWKIASLWNTLGYCMLDQKFLEKSLTKTQIIFNPVLRSRIVGNEKGFFYKVLSLLKSEGLVFTVKNILKRLNKIFFKNRKNVGVEAEVGKIMQKIFGDPIKFDEEKKSLFSMFVGFSDLNLFVDPIEKEACSKYLKDKENLVIQYPSFKKADTDHLRASIEGGKMLFILTTGYCSEDKLRNNQFSSILIGIKAILKKYPISQIDLKTHPREKFLWPEDLKLRLEQKGLNVHIVHERKPIRKIVDSYDVVSGFVSSAFRDAAFSAKRTSVWGIESISHFVGSTMCAEGEINTLMWFGEGAGINWVMEDGKLWVSPSVDKNRDLPRISEVCINYLESQ